MALLFAQVGHSASGDEPAQQDFKLWYQRAISGEESVSEAISADSPLRLYKWSNPLKVVTHLDDETTHHGPELRAYVRDYLRRFIDTTNITAALVSEGDNVASNVIIIVGDSASDGAKRYRDEITAMWGDGGKKADKIIADPDSTRMNCFFTLRPREKESDDIAAALIFAPIAEDIFATQKCIGKMLFRVLGMLGDPEGESVLNRADAAILPTKDDLRALRIHYINQIENGDTPSDIVSVIGKAIEQGVLP